MLPVPGLRFLRHLRPGTAEVSFVTSSVWVIGRRRSSNLTVINAVIAVLRWNAPLGIEMVKLAPADDEKAGRARPWS
jgi:hypothetical protein